MDLWATLGISREAGIGAVVFGSSRSNRTAEGGSLRWTA